MFLDISTRILSETYFTQVPQRSYHIDFLQFILTTIITSNTMIANEYIMLRDETTC